MSYSGPTFASDTLRMHAQETAMSYSGSAAPGDPCATTASPSGRLLGWRIGGLFAILGASLIGVTLPYLAVSRKLQSMFFVLRAAAAGVVLMTGAAASAG